MTTILLPPDEQTDQEFLVECWREHRLLQMGFTVAKAQLLASERIDLHELEHLLAAGCDPTTAVRILL